MGVVNPAPGFLPGLRQLCDQHGALLIFDEVITGFRLALGGARSISGSRPTWSPSARSSAAACPWGPTAAAGSCWSRWPPAARCTRRGPSPATRWPWPRAWPSFPTWTSTRRCIPPSPSWRSAWPRACARPRRTPAPRCGSTRWAAWWRPSSPPGPVEDFSSASRSDLDKYAAYFGEMLARGVYLAPAQFEAMFVSYAHTQGGHRPDSAGGGGGLLPAVPVKATQAGHSPARLRRAASRAAGGTPPLGGAGECPAPRTTKKQKNGRLTPSFSVTACRPGGPQPSSSFSSSRA